MTHLLCFVVVDGTALSNPHAGVADAGISNSLRTAARNRGVAPAGCSVLAIQHAVFNKHRYRGRIA